MKIECPHCHQHYEIEEEMRGRVQCTTCLNEFEITAPNLEEQPKPFSDKIMDALKKDIGKSALPKHTAQEANKKEYKPLLVVSILPGVFIFFGICSILYTIHTVSSLEEAKSAIHQILLASIITAGLISSILFIGFARIIKSGIIMETYIKDIHRLLSQQKK